MKIKNPDVTWFEAHPDYWMGNTPGYRISAFKHEEGPNSGKWSGDISPACIIPGDKFNDRIFADFQSVKDAVEEEIIRDVGARVILARHTINLLTDQQLDEITNIT